MEELDFIKNERLKLQEEYLKQSKNIFKADDCKGCLPFLFNN